MVRRGLIVLCASAIAAAAAAHTFYAALTRIDFNAQAGTLEVIHRLAAHDMEAVLSFADGERLTFEDFERAEALAGAYLTEHFRIEVDALPLSLEFLGVEVTGEDLWAFFEAPLKTAPQTLQIENTIFIEELPEQVNTVVATIGAGRASARFVRGKERARLSLPSPPPDTDDR